MVTTLSPAHTERGAPSGGGGRFRTERCPPGDRDVCRLPGPVSPPQFREILRSPRGHAGRPHLPATLHGRSHFRETRGARGLTQDGSGATRAWSSHSSRCPPATSLKTPVAGEVGTGHRFPSLPPAPHPSSTPRDIWTIAVPPCLSPEPPFYKERSSPFQHGHPQAEARRGRDECQRREKQNSGSGGGWGAHVRVRTGRRHRLRRGPGGPSPAGASWPPRSPSTATSQGPLHLHCTSEMAFLIGFNPAVMLCALTSQWLSHWSTSPTRGGHGKVEPRRGRLAGGINTEFLFL